MPLARRYTPEWAPGEYGVIGADFSVIIPPGVGIDSGTLFIETNTAIPAVATTDFVSPMTDPTNPDYILAVVAGRAVYCSMGGGVDGRDYRLIWTVVDSEGNVWPRTALMLCAQTS